MRLRRSILSFVVSLAVLAGSAGAAEPVTPEETLKRYLTAIQDQDFNKAFDLVSKGMKTDRQSGKERPREVWVKESQYIVQLSEAKIFDFQIFQLGVEEHELYTLVKEDGVWKVDQQEMVIDAPGLAKWFPKK
jgi:hypothetical protein